MRTWRRVAEVPNRGRPARFSALCAALLALAATSQVLAVLDLKRGDAAPPISAVAMDGREVELSGLNGRSVVVLFAEAGQERSQQAALSVARALMQEGLDGAATSFVVVYTKGSDVDAIEYESRGMRAAVPGVAVIHDVERRTLGAYHAVALPSTVVIDGEGRIVHAVAGLSPRFEHIISDALLLAAGRMTAEQFDAALNGGAETRDESQLRAERLAQMARSLRDRGQYEAAEGHYLDALSLSPGLIHARLGLADLLVRRGRLDDAETGFRSVLHAYPKSLEGTSGLALVHALRGETDEAERLAREVLDRSPSRARPHYILGMVHEQRGEHARAAVAYRKAAEVLLNRVGLEDPTNGGSPPHP
jgi:tetratricopeptide (TPR) repeat protein